MITLRCTWQQLQNRWRRWLHQRS